MGRGPDVLTFFAPMRRKERVRARMENEKLANGSSLPLLHFKTEVFSAHESVD